MNFQLKGNTGLNSPYTISLAIFNIHYQVLVIPGAMTGL